MKKVKFLLGFLIIGVGLLFNQSFARTLYVDTSAYGGIYGDRNSLTSAMYKWTFKNTIYNYSSSDKWGWLGYSLYYDGTTGINIMNQNSQANSCPTTYSGIIFNSSIYSYTPYNWTCSASRQNVAHYDMYYTTNYKSNTSVPIQILLGRGSEFGNIFIGVQNAKAEMPIYGFGKGFASSNSFITVLDTDTSYLRLFGDIKVSQNIFSFNDYDPITMSGPYATGLDGWEYFYPRGTRTNYGYIVDDGNNNQKFKHFGLYDMGYSYIYGKGITESASTISRDRLRFVTVEDNIEVELKDRGDIPYSVFQLYSYPGLLLLKGTSYSSMGNDRGAYILSKDPTNPSRVLYEHWSCNMSSIQSIFSGGNDLQSCLKLDGGYLTYNNSTSVLPFTDFYSFTGFNNSGSLLLYDLMYGSDGTGYVHGESEIKNGKIYFNGTSRGYGFVSNDSVNLQELYLNGGTNSSTLDSISTDIFVNCRNDPNFFDQNYLICKGLSSSLGQPINVPGTMDQYVNYGLDGSGNFIVWYTYQDDLNEQNSGYSRVTTETGGYSLVCTNPDGCYTFNTGTVYFGSSGVDISGTGLQEISSRYDDYFENGFFFKCPFPYDSSRYKSFTLFGSERFVAKIGTHIFYPIYCQFAGYNAGKNVKLFGNTDDIFSERFFNNPDYKIFYNFFDIILSVAILLLFFKLYHLINN